MDTSERTMEGLRNRIWDTLDGLQDQTISPAQGNAVANISGKLLKSVAIEIDYQRLTGVQRRIAMLDHEPAER